ncbi:MAG: polysaccharide deacetylase family protein [Parafilimonas sp.]
MIVIYCDNITSRLQYIVKTLFGIDVTLRSCAEKQADENFPIIDYTQAKFSPASVWIRPHALLFQDDISTQNIECFEWNGLKAFFKTSGDISFDIFAASFYLITRYEEYLPHILDKYGRYVHTNSLAFREDFLQLPLINLWLAEFSTLLQHKPPAFNLQSSTFNLQLSTFSFLSTYDIDIAYAYKHHSLIQTAGGYLKDLITGKWNQLAHPSNVFLGSKKDPFDIYEWLHELNDKYNLKPVYFFLVAETRKGYDKNLSPHTEGIKNLIRQHAAKYAIGIHPSWQSNTDEKILQHEIELLDEITNSKIENSRQHYIKLKFPETYRALIKQGIKNDYSMGYGSINGFRASYCLPYQWFDLKKNEQTGLMIHPFCYMDANSFFEQHYSAQQAAEELQHYYDIVKKVNGKLITIFHNHFLTEQSQWLPWRRMYEDFLRKNFL